jgi:hypothetical protein
VDIVEEVITAVDSVDNEVAVGVMLLLLLFLTPQLLTLKAILSSQPDPT